MVKKYEKLKEAVRDYICFHGPCANSVGDPSDDDGWICIEESCEYCNLIRAFDAIEEK